MGIRWIGEIGDEDLDAQAALWDMHRIVDYAAVPAGRTVRASSGSSDVPSATRDWCLGSVRRDRRVSTTFPASRSRSP